MTGFALKLPGRCLSASKLGQQSGLQSVGSGVETCCFFKHYQIEPQRVCYLVECLCATVAGKLLYGSF